MRTTKISFSIFALHNHEVVGSTNSQVATWMDDCLRTEYNQSPR